MKMALVEFIVQIPDSSPDGIESVVLAMNQAERYLNTGDRCVDFNIRFLSSEEEANGMSLLCHGRGLPLPADHLAGRDC